MNPSNQPLSDCHQAPVVYVEGNAWDVPLESIKPGSTYTYGCPVCHKACGVYVADQPEPNYAQYICKGAHCKCMNNDGTCKAFHNGDHTCPSSQPDAQAGDDDTDVTISPAQAEVGLQEKIFNLVQLYSQCNLDECTSCNKQAAELTALFQADKSAAVVEARIDENKRALAYHQSQGDTPSDRNWNMMEYYLPERIARLQPPTAGEGESV